MQKKIRKKIDKKSNNNLETNGLDDKFKIEVIDNEFKTKKIDDKPKTGVISDEFEMKKSNNKFDIKKIKKNDPTEIDDKLGHRNRLRIRFWSAPIRSLPDYEILEMLLFHIFSRRDTKVMAKELLKIFGSLQAIIFADVADLMAIHGFGYAASMYFKLLADTFSRLCLPVKMGKTCILGNWLSVLNYCQLTMGFKKKESFRVLFLNKKNALIADELCDAGTIDKISIYPREIVKQALLHSASAIILVHNHPSGDPEPSKDDMEITKKIRMALEIVGVTMHDHIIVARNNHFSFRVNNLL